MVIVVVKVWYGKVGWNKVGLVWARVFFCGFKVVLCFENQVFESF
jgi:hypothetical protein